MLKIDKTKKTNIINFLEKYPHWRPLSISNHQRGTKSHLIVQKKGGFEPNPLKNKERVFKEYFSSKPKIPLKKITFAGKKDIPPKSILRWDAKVNTDYKLKDQSVSFCDTKSLGETSELYLKQKSIPIAYFYRNTEICLAESISGTTYIFDSDINDFKTWESSEQEVLAYSEFNSMVPEEHTINCFCRIGDYRRYYGFRHFFYFIYW